MRVLSPLLLLSLFACSVTTLPSHRNPYELPLKNGLVGYCRTEVKKGVKLDEFYRVARAWIRENKAYYQLEWERPILNTTLLHSGIIPSNRVQDDSLACYSTVHIEYYLTIIAKDDTCKIMASTFQVQGLRQQPLFIEQVADNKILCQSVNREMNELVNSLGIYIGKSAEKPW